MPLGAFLFTLITTYSYHEELHYLCLRRNNTATENLFCYTYKYIRLQQRAAFYAESQMQGRNT